MALLFGTAGIPISASPRNTLGGVSRVAELGLGMMELEFVQNVNVSKELAPQVKKLASEKGVALTAHGTYYVNLNAKEEKKLEAGMQRILLGAERLWECGGKSIVFHPAFYLGDAPEAAYKNVRKSLSQMAGSLREKGAGVTLRPETTGRPSQFGTLEEICRLSQEVEGVLPCVDFGHLHARSNGKFNSFEEFSGVMATMEKHLGKSILKNLHCHVEGIEFGEKGEKRHLELEQSSLKFKELLRALKEFKCEGVIVSESPNIEGDALLMKKEYAKM